ncbi:MAG: hypothetical protein WAV30_02675 [Microgenomates group bacterium]
MSSSVTPFLFIGEIVLIYILSRLVLQKAYKSFHQMRWSNSSTVRVVSFLYAPGTIIHELSHYVVALLLNMHPREMSFFPVVEGNKVKLGHVIYEKNKGDFIRPLLVGIAPFFGAIGVLWLFIYGSLFPGTEWWQTILFGYLILAITANMFSSPQDLIDIGYVVPLCILVGFILYLFPVSIPSHYLVPIGERIHFFILTIQPPLLFSVGFHAILVVLLSRLK